MQNVSIKLYSIDVVEIQLLKKYKDYANVFSEKEVVKMPDFVYIKHSIFVEKDKNVSFKFIYSLSANKLCILHNYLNLSLIKNQI